MEKDLKVKIEVDEDRVAAPAPRDGGQVRDVRYALGVAILKCTLEEKTKTGISVDEDEQRQTVSPHRTISSLRGLRREMRSMHFRNDKDESTRAKRSA